MSNITQLLNQKKESKEQWVQNKKDERARVGEIQEQGLSEIAADPGKYLAYLNMQARHPNLSAGNAVLIMQQNPHATQVASFDDWKRRGRNVNRGENGVSILVPEKYSHSRTLEHTDDYTGEVYTQSIQERRQGYKLAKVFDVSQTNGKPVPEPLKLQDNTPQMDAALKALLDSCPVPVQSDATGEIAAYYDEHTQTVYVNPELSDSETFYSLAAEVVQAQVHSSIGEDYDRESQELPAASVAYMLCRRFGVDAAPPDVSQAPEYFAGDEPSDIRGTLSALKDFAKEIGTRVDREVSPHQKAVPAKAPFRNASAR